MIALNDEMFDLWVRTLSSLVSDIKQVSHFRLDKSLDPPVSAEPSQSDLTLGASIGKSGIIGILGTKDKSSAGCSPRASTLGTLPDRLPPRTHRTFSDLEEQNAEKMVTLPEVLSMCRKIGISHKVGQSNPSASPGVASAQQNTHDNIGLIEMYFRSIDHDRRGILDFEQFRAIVKMIRANPDVADIWRKLSSAEGDGRGTGISLKAFGQWLRVGQGVSESSIVIDAKSKHALPCSHRLPTKISNRCLMRSIHVPIAATVRATACPSKRSRHFFCLRTTA